MNSGGLRGERKPFIRATATGSDAQAVRRALDQQHHARRRMRHGLTKLDALASSGRDEQHTETRPRASLI